MVFPLLLRAELLYWLPVRNQWEHVVKGVGVGVCVWLTCYIDLAFTVCVNARLGLVQMNESRASMFLPLELVEVIRPLTESGKHTCREAD